MRRLGRDQRGVIIVMFALLLPILVGFLGLGVEVGFWYQHRRGLQTVADAAAVAGAFIKYGGGSNSTASTAATTDATRNGYDTSTDTISISTPPATGSFTADDKAVEVNMTRQVQLLFAGYFLDNAVNIDVRAVATTLDSTDTACVLSLDTSSATGVDVSGNGTVTFDGCQVAANSTSDSALDVSGNGDLETDCYTVAGGVSATSGLSLDSGCSPKTNAPAVDDPYSDLVAPSAPCDNNGITHDSTSPLTISNPGDYVTPVVICGDLNVKKGTVTLEPGLYIIDGGDFKSNSQGNIVGEGVTIVLKNDAQINNFNGGSSVNLSAPDTTDSAGDWEGILVYQDRDTTSSCTGNNCNTLNGNSSSTFQGVMYFPNQEINVNGGNESASTCLQIVALRVGFSGNGDVNADTSGCEDAGVTGIPLPGNVGLVE